VAAEISLVVARNAKNNKSMSVAEEIVSIVEQLPPDKAQSVLDFARYLAEKHADAEWEKRLAIAHTQPKFRALVEEAERDDAAGRSEPMDFDKL
jgi:hypothetical protein